MIDIAIRQLRRLLTARPCSASNVTVCALALRRFFVVAIGVVLEIFWLANCRGCLRRGCKRAQSMSEQRDGGKLSMRADGVASHSPESKSPNRTQRLPSKRISCNCRTA
jgi:hypothetical protein